MPPLPQMRDVRSASVGPAPTPGVRPGPLGDLLKDVGQGAGDIEDALRKRDDDDGRIWAAKTVTELRGAYNKKLTDARNSGADLTGLVPKLDQELKDDLARARTAAPNKRGAYHLDLATPDFTTDVNGAAYETEARYRITKRVEDTQGLINDNRNQIFQNPRMFAKAYAETKTLVDGLELPAEMKAKLHEDVRGLADSAVQGMIENGSPYEALKMLKSGAWNNYLDADRLAARTNQAQAEIKRREAEAKANLAAARAENFQDAADLAQSDLTSRRMTGKGVTPEQQKTIRAGFTDKQWEKYLSAGEKADQIFKVTGDLRSQSYTEIQKTLDAAKPQAGEADFAERQAAFAEAQKIASDVINDRKRDPGQAARDAYPNVADAWKAVEANNNDPGWTRVAIKRSLAAQTAMGIPADQQKPLPGQVAAAVAGDIRSAAPDKAAGKLQAYQQLYGANWSKVLGQVAPHLDSNSSVAATLTPNAAAILLSTSRAASSLDGGKPGTGINELRRTLGVKASGEGSIADIIANDPDFKDFRQAMVRRGRGDTVGNAWANATEVLAIGIMQREGVGIEEATARAIKETVQDKHNFGRINGVPFATPKAIDADAVERGASEAMGALKEDGIDIPESVPGAQEKDTREAYVSAVRRGGYFVTGKDGLELWANDAPVTRHGEPVRFSWDVLATKGGASPIMTPAQQAKRYGFEPLKRN